MLATGVTLGLAEWIIDDTFLYLITFTAPFVAQTRKQVFKKIMENCASVC